MMTDEPPPPSLGEQFLAYLTAGPAAPASDGPAEPARFDGVDLRAEAVAGAARGDPPPAWWDAAEKRVRVADAVLPGASLRSANLAGVCLENANLAGADLADADLTGAVLGGANLSAALLEDADLRDAHLRFADLGMAALEGADLRGADLWGAKCREADLDKIDFRKAELEEADLRDVDARECDFREARLGLTDFRGADLKRSDFRGAVLRGTKFDGADLQLANLQDLDLSGCALTHVRLADARMDGTRLSPHQFGGALGEEAAGDYEAAVRGYRTLERNFAGQGDPDAASWAYRKRRRMAKRQAGREALRLMRGQSYGVGFDSAFQWLADWVVELVCDYGDSVPRVLMTYLVVVIGFGLGYAAGGAVERDAAGGGRAVTRTVDDMILYSLKAMIAPGEPPDGLHAAGYRVQLATMVQSSAGLFLIGLLGFVAGNRIRR